MVLEQKSLFDSYYLSLDDLDLRYKKSNFYTYTERSVPLDTLNLRGLSITRHVDIGTVVIGGCIFLAGFFGISLLTQDIPNNESFGIILGSAFLLAAIVGIIWGLNQIAVRVYIYSTTGFTIGFFHNKPNHQVVDEFITKLKAAQKKLFLERYGTFDNYLPLQDQLNNLQWLRNNNFITHEEYEEKRKAFTNTSEKRIGY